MFHVKRSTVVCERQKKHRHRKTVLGRFVELRITIVHIFYPSDTAHAS